MNTKTLAVLAALTFSAPALALEVGNGSSHSFTHATSSTRGLTTSIDVVNGVEINKIRQGDKKGKRVTWSNSVTATAGRYGSHTHSHTVDNARFDYIGGLVTGSGHRSSWSHTNGYGVNVSANVSSYAGYERTRNGANRAFSTFSGVSTDVAVTRDRFHSHSSSNVSYAFSE